MDNENTTLLRLPDPDPDPTLHVRDLRAWLQPFGAVPGPVVAALLGVPGAALTAWTASDGPGDLDGADLAHCPIPRRVADRIRALSPGPYTGAGLAAWRARFGLSTVEAAEALGVPVRRIEAAEAEPVASLPRYVALALAARDALTP